MLWHDLGAIPRSAEEREAWVSTLSERLLELYEGEAVER